MPEGTRAHIGILTDSAACIPREEVKRYGIEVVPFELIWDGRIYRDGLDLEPQEFYQRFRTSATHPTTSTPTLGAFMAAYHRLAERFTGIVAIHVSQRLTSTICLSEEAARAVPDVPVRVVDAHTAASSEGFVVLAAARAAAQGATLEEVVAVAEACRERVGMFFAMQTLEHLRRGGRIGKAATLLGSRLQIIPMMTVRDGVVTPIRITRNWQRALREVLDQTCAVVGDRPVRIASWHADMRADAEALLAQARERMHVIEGFLETFTPVMGAHTGPGIVGLSYCIES